MRSIEIKPVTGEAVDAAVKTITLAFGSDPAARWFYPDPQQYREYFPAFIRAFAGRALEHGSAHCTHDYSGAAFWLPPNVRPDEDALLALLNASVPAQEQPERFALMEQMAGYHPREPHWYLPMIGVVPEKQGNGYGSALLAHALRRCDEEGGLAYLESSNPKNVPLYERHGFELAGLIQVGSSPPLFPMVRRPRK